MTNYYLAMDCDGRLYIATEGNLYSPVYWERIPYAGAGLLQYDPIESRQACDVVRRRHIRPDWAVDCWAGPIEAALDYHQNVT